MTYSLKDYYIRILKIGNVSPKGYLILFFVLSLLTTAHSQEKNKPIMTGEELSWFISANFGLQMSGMKSEDFVHRNRCPLFNFTIGKWFSPYLAFQIGSKGFYYNYIEDNFNHHYNYLYGEAVFNVNNAIWPKRIDKRWSLLLHGGAGYFYNHVYRKANICEDLGLQNSYQLTNQFDASVDISSIFGWNIYQGNEDILPGITLGVSYLFNGIHF